MIDRKAETDSAGACFLFLCTSPAPQMPTVFSSTRRDLFYEAITGMHAQAAFLFALEVRQIHSQCVATQSISVTKECSVTRVFRRDFVKTVLSPKVRSFQSGPLHLHRLH